MPKNKVLLPINEDEFTLQIIPYVFRYLAPEENDLIFLYVGGRRTEHASYQPQSQASMFYGSRGSAEVQGSFSDEVQPYTHALQQAGFRVTTKIAFGQSTEAIEQYIQSEAINLVVMATVSQSTPSLLPSTRLAQQVVQHTTIPIMLYHTDGISLN